MDWVEIAKVGRPHGVRGQVHVSLYNSQSKLLCKDRIVRWSKAAGAERMLRIGAARAGNKSWLVHFDEVADREQAATLTHGVLAVDRQQFAALEDGEYYHLDVIGAVVHDVDGERLGVVKAILTTNIDLLEIDLDSGPEVLVPIIADYVVSIGEEPDKVVIRDLDHWMTD